MRSGEESDETRAGSVAERVIRLMWHLRHDDPSSSTLPDLVSVYDDLVRITASTGVVERDEQPTLSGIELRLARCLAEIGIESDELMNCRVCAAFVSRQFISSFDAIRLHERNVLSVSDRIDRLLVELRTSFLATNADRDVTIQNLAREIKTECRELEAARMRCLKDFTIPKQ